jgi:hypothetical protein
MAVKQHPGYCTVVMELHRGERANGVSKPFTAVGKTVGGLSTHRAQEPLKGEIFANTGQSLGPSQCFRLYLPQEQHRKNGGK